jgi:hypothetical protein
MSSPFAKVRLDGLNKRLLSPIVMLLRLPAFQLSVQHMVLTKKAAM